MGTQVGQEVARDMGTQVGKEVAGTGGSQVKLPVWDGTFCLPPGGRKATEFQGEWFVVGLAGSTHRKTDRFLLNPFIATFEQNENSRLEVSYAMTRGHRCVTWSYVLVPAAQPGRFWVDSREEPEEVQVYDTDYSVFALMLFRRQSGGQSILRVNLLCRMWMIQTQVLDKFVCLVRALGLSDNNIVFPDLTDRSPHLGTC
ncbi:epididymal-specific lipocalin-12 [Halichoerus grypus]